jgi:hypothetical protein
MVALLRAGAPVQPRHAKQALAFVPAALRAGERAARKQAAWRAAPRRVAAEQEEMVGLAQDVRALREAQAEVAANQARLRALEEEEEEEGGGATSSGETGSDGAGDDE